MQYRKLGSSDLEVSVVAMGCWALGGDEDFWGPVDDNESIAAVQQALDLGINLIDTAAAYGVGHSEEIVGKAIAGRRDEAVIATKCGLVWKDKTSPKTRCLKRDSVIRECESSLRRLRVEAIDLYQIHWPDPETPIAETMEALVKLREQGKIRAIGCELMSEARRYGPLECLQPPLSMLSRDSCEELLPYCLEYNMGVICYGPMARGLLTGKFDASSTFTDLRKNDVNFSGEQFARNLSLVESLRPIAEKYGRTLSQLALRWVIQQPGVTSAIAGAKRASQVRENSGAGDFEISPEDMMDIETLLTE